MNPSFTAHSNVGAGALLQQLAALQRRRKPMLVVFGVIAAIAVIAAFVWPPTYRSTATILIEQQEVPADLVRSMVSSYADQRIQVITQRVMTSDNLIKIIDRYDLYSKQRRREPRETVLQRMRDDIDFEMISADVIDPRLGRPTKATIAFSLSFEHRSPAVAAKVANELTTLYLNENLQSRRRLADDTATFLTGEAERLERRIGELDAQIAALKEKQGDRLPELMPMNLQLMSRAEEELRETRTRIRTLDQQVIYTQAQLAQLNPTQQLFTSTGERVLAPADRLKMLKSEYARVSAIYAAGHPDVVRMKREIDGLQREVGPVDTGNDIARQLSDAQGELAQAREKYAADHPDVQRLERLVASIQAMQSEASTAEPAPVDADNPIYIQMRAQQEAAVNERASLQDKAAALEARIADLEQRLSKTPQAEREYNGLTRELDSAQLKYREVRQKQMEATLSQNLESERKSERFTLIEPPLVAEEPISPNRAAILVLGGIFAALCALAAALALESVDTRIRDKRDIETLLAVPALAVLPWIETRAERSAHTRMRRRAMLGTAASAAVAVALIHLLYRPLDVLWQIAVRRLWG